MRISSLLKILLAFFALNLVFGGRAFYSLFIDQKNIAALIPPSVNHLPSWASLLQVHSEWVLFSFLILVAICAVTFVIAGRTLLSLRNLHQTIDHQVGERFPVVGASPYVAHEIKAFERDLNTVARKLEEYGQLCLDASPLTRLPGNIAIERVLVEKMHLGEKFSLCYVDLDNFKFFNDRYGFAAGSEVLKMTGEVVRNAQQVSGNPDDFVGHIGGDDFVIITAPDKAEAICQRIIKEFDQAIIRFYPPDDLQEGALIGKDRFGVERTFSVMTISISVVSDEHRDLKSPTEIARIAAEIKEYVKQLSGSNYLIDRRRRPFSE